MTQKNFYDIIKAPKQYKKGVRKVRDNMNNSELITVTIDNYVNLQRIKAVNTCENAELDYQIKVTEAKLNALGVNTKDLTCNS